MAKKTEVVRIRMTPEEKEVMEQAALSDDLTLSAWLRRHLRRAAGIYPTQEVRHATD